MRRFFIIAALLVVGILCALAFPRSDHDGDVNTVAAARAILNDGVLRAVILGDSLAHGAGDETGGGIARSLGRQLQMTGVRSAVPINLGINGARTFNVRSLLAQSAARSTIRAADVIVISIGGNDLYGDTGARLLSRLLPGIQQGRIVGRVMRLVAEVRAINPAARIYLLGLYDPYRHSPLAGWLDTQVNHWDARLIEAFATCRGITVIRICDLLSRDDRISPLDHFHPGSIGYEAIAYRIASSL